ncbi:MAG: transposase, partial [Rhizobiales bacterium]|nr:transposase [Hyphomicrobiales bacterium]
ARNAKAITTEAALDGLYVVRTSLPKDKLDDQDAIRAYKSLARVERAFRSLKTVDLAIRPVHHRLAPRVQAHVFLCMLAYHVEWHMRQCLAPILYDETDRDAAEAMRHSAVEKASPSPENHAKRAKRRTADGHKVSSFQSLIAQLATLTRNATVAPGNKSLEITLYARPTDIQTKAFELLGIDPQRTQ